MRHIIENHQRRHGSHVGDGNCLPDGSSEECKQNWIMNSSCDTLWNSSTGSECVWPRQTASVLEAKYDPNQWHATLMTPALFNDLHCDRPLTDEVGPARHPSCCPSRQDIILSLRQCSFRAAIRPVGWLQFSCRLLHVTRLISMLSSVLCQRWDEGHRNSAKVVFPVCWEYCVLFVILMLLMFYYKFVT